MTTTPDYFLLSLETYADFSFFFLIPSSVKQIDPLKEINTIVIDCTGASCKDSDGNTKAVEVLSDLYKYAYEYERHHSPVKGLEWINSDWYINKEDPTININGSVKIISAYFEF